MRDLFFLAMHSHVPGVLAEATILVELLDDVCYLDALSESHMPELPITQRWYIVEDTDLPLLHAFIMLGDPSSEIVLVRVTEKSIQRIWDEFSDESERTRWWFHPNNFELDQMRIGGNYNADSVVSYLEGDILVYNGWPSCRVEATIDFAISFEAISDLPEPARYKKVSDMVNLFTHCCEVAGVIYDTDDCTMDLSNPQVSVINIICYQPNSDDVYFTFTREELAQLYLDVMQYLVTQEAIEKGERDASS